MNKPEHECHPDAGPRCRRARDPSYCSAKAASRYRNAVLDERITVCTADPSWPELVPARGGTAAKRAARRSRSGNPAYRQYRGSGPGCQAHRRFDGRNSRARTDRGGWSNGWRGSATKASAKPACPVDGPCASAMSRSPAILRSSPTKANGGSSTSPSGTFCVRMPRLPGTTLRRNGMPSAMARICCSPTRTRSAS